MEIGGIDRRKARLTSQISVLSKKKNDGLDSLVGLTVDAVLGKSQELLKPIQQPQTRTLLDIISDEESGTAYRGLAALNSNKNKKKSKKSIKDRLKFRRPGSSWSSSSSRPVPTSDFPLNDRRIQRISNPILVDHPPLACLSSYCSIRRTYNDDVGKSDSSSDDAGKPDSTTTTFKKEETTTDHEDGKSDSSNEDAEREIDQKIEVAREKEEEENESKPAAPTESESKSEEEEEEEVRNASGPLISEPTTDDEEDEEENESGPFVTESMVEAPTISLMALLEESGRLAEEEEEEVEEEDEEEEEEEGGGVEYVCTVCMVKHRRLAFVPCGHTFCKICSKELWVSRGNCPLCTGYILEILDIF